jgi:5-methylcytosine-specific restriction endonuclease McrA
MSVINWALPSDMFSELNKLLQLLPQYELPEIKMEKSIDELLSGIDLGGYVMEERSITEEELKALVSGLSEGQSLTAKGRAFALYIEDKKNMFPTDDVEILPKVHITNCYHVAAWSANMVMVINPTGSFNITFAAHSVGKRLGGAQRVAKNLRICKSCKESLKSQKKGLISRFGLAGKSTVWSSKQWRDWNVFQTTQSSTQVNSTSRDIRLTPPSGIRQAGETSASNMGYVENWDEISVQRKIATNWTCSDCGVCLSGHHNLLHTHHLNRDKQNNSDTNLRVLCKCCHREQGFHRPNGAPDDHGQLVEKDVRSWFRDQETISKLRSEQGISRTVTPLYLS